MQMLLSCIIFNCMFLCEQNKAAYIITFEIQISFEYSWSNIDAGAFDKLYEEFEIAYQNWWLKFNSISYYFKHYFVVWILILDNQFYVINIIQDKLATRNCAIRKKNWLLLNLQCLQKVSKFVLLWQWKY